MVFSFVSFFCLGYIFHEKCCIFHLGHQFLKVSLSYSSQKHFLKGFLFWNWNNLFWVFFCFSLDRNWAFQWWEKKVCDRFFFTILPLVQGMSLKLMKKLLIREGFSHSDILVGPSICEVNSLAVRKFRNSLTSSFWSNFKRFVLSHLLI